MTTKKEKTDQDEMPAGGQALEKEYFRPAERVMNYLISEFDRPDLKDGCRLPSVRQLARQLNVSTATVQSVFGRLSKMGRIRSEVGNGSFLVAAPNASKDSYLIGLNIPAPTGTALKDSRWTFKIYGGILHGILQSPTPVAIQSLPLDMTENEGSWERLAAGARDLDGLILFPSLYNRRLRKLYRKEGRPFVDLNPSHEQSTANFVSPAYYDVSLRLGRAWRQTGRKRIAILAHPSMERSVSVRLRCCGLIAALEEDLGTRVTARVLSTGGVRRNSGYEAMTQALTGGFIPDAVYCVGDPLALGALDALKEAGLRVPEDVSVVGGSGLGEEGDRDDHALTSMRQPLEEIGEALIAMLLKRIANPEADFPGRYFSIAFHLGHTTRPEENTLLDSERKV